MRVRNAVPDKEVMLAEIRHGLDALHLVANDDQCSQLLAYCELLLKWNKAYNLIGSSTAGDIVSRHILDSLVVQPQIKQQRLIDVGCGAGLPGIPLAIMCPEKNITLLDSNGKKTRFVAQAIRTLELANAEVIHGRVEEWQPDQPYEAVISRAYAALGKGLSSCDHLLAAGGRFYFLKGRISEEELREVVKPYTLLRSQPLAVPGTSGERHLIEIIKAEG
jgi:16S rRNA (guanine527-N7)-methyltransferase